MAKKTTTGIAATDATSFWDSTWQKTFKPMVIDQTAFRNMTPHIDRYFAAIGDVQGKEVLDLGCGNGKISVYLARAGATVTAIDLSPISVQNTKLLAEYNQVGARVSTVVLDSLDVRTLHKHFDLVIGKDILHHIEPFDAFVDALYDVLKPGGRGLFIENSARNPILMFFRRHLVGRFGIPKYGDDAEYPLEPREIALLRRKFPRTTQYYPEFKFFIMMAIYLFHGNKTVSRIAQSLDEAIYRYLPFFNKYSYRQIVEVQR